MVPIARMVARELCRRSPAYEQNTVIVGAGDIGQLIGRKLIKHPEYGANVVGFVDRAPRSAAQTSPSSSRSSVDPSGYRTSLTASMSKEW